MAEKTNADDRKAGRRILLALLFGLLALVYAPLMIAALVNPSAYAESLACLIATAAVYGSLIFGASRLLSAKWMQAWGLGLSDRLATSAIPIVSASIVAERAAVNLLVSHSMLAFPCWLLWFFSRSAYLLSFPLVLCLIVTTFSKWKDTRPLGRLARAVILLGLLASMWLQHTTRLPSEVTNVLLPP